MNELTRQRIILIGFLLLFGNQFVVVYTYLMAYLHNGATLVHVNLFGEQYLDAIVLGITIFISCSAFYLLYQQHTQILKKIDSKS
ncbi:MAG: hypothetical protein KKG04_03280 [Candidatus Thermoplasmatota archaeon]|nr:hypothetical protein [Candidatus Thermoplasmatota archaeon]